MMASPAASAIEASLESRFREPPAEARPYVWWHWMGANISREGITKDLEAMKAAGIGGATVFNLSSGVRESQAPIGDLPWPERTYRSEEYWACLRHAAAEARRLGLELGLHNTVGYSTTGGPWVSEARSMKKVVWSETAVVGGAPVDVMLPRPKADLNGGWGGLHREPSGFYRDIAVIAVPRGDRPIARDALIDVSSRMGPDGRLSWSDAPAGDWSLVRLGYGPTGSTPHPVPDELIGGVREVDKLDAEANREHWQAVLAPLREKLGDLVGTGLRHLLIDSYEAGHQNWTDGFRERFQLRFGYDPAPWLVTRSRMLSSGKSPAPVRIIGNESLTARFDFDLKTLVAETMLGEGWAVGVAQAHEAGLTMQMEPYGGPFDTVATAAAVDLPMGEFWSDSDGGISWSVVAGGRAAGRRVIGAEAFTGRPNLSGFSETPAQLLKGTLGAYAKGVNRLVLHHWVHQPFDDRFVPGQGMGWWGTHFGRNQTWFEGGKAWLALAGRCQVLLQHGETPVAVLSVDRPVGESDAVSSAVLVASARAEGGQVVLPSGRRYPVLMVPHEGAITPEVLAKVRSLLHAGVAVVARPPTRSPSLKNFPACDAEVAAIAADLWRPGAELRLFPDLGSALNALALPAPARAVRGQVKLVERVAPDAEVVYVANLTAESQQATISLPGSGRGPEIWNPEDGGIAGAPVWRVVGDRTEVDLGLAPMTARFIVRRASSQGTPKITAVRVEQGAAEIMGTNDGPVVRSGGPATVVVEARDRRTRLTLQPAAEPAVVRGPWKLVFRGPGTSGGTLELSELIDWTAHTDPLVRYASGTGTYTVEVNVPATWLEKRGRVRLDLGQVSDVAQVWFNGQAVGTAWRAPYQVDVTGAVRPGVNTLVIAVSNTWHNRLVGDEQEPADCEWGAVKSLGGVKAGRPLIAFPEWFRLGQPRPTARRTFVTWNYVEKDTPLLPAGLRGPVRLVPVAENTLAGK